MDNENRGIERRRYKRVKAKFIVTCKVDKSMEFNMCIEKREISALMLDLSEKGMALLTVYNIPVSTPMIINFVLINLCVPADDRVRAMEIVGEVRYNVLIEDKEHRLGIYFKHIAEEDQFAIADFVKMRENQRYLKNYRSKRSRRRQSKKKKAQNSS
jgi:c-di-GMP-binding flagellar brake protein YcgR